MTFNIYNLKIKAKTWRRDSFGLFDYETNKYTDQSISVTADGKIVRTNNQLSFINSITALKGSKKEEQVLGPEDENLINITDTANGVKIVTETQDEESPDRFWIVIEQEEGNEGHALRADDVIKFGRVVFRVKQLRIMDKSDQNKKPALDSLRDQLQMLKAPFIVSSIHSQSMRSSTTEIVCKICLSEKSDDIDDPLISPCNCLGSVKYVHLKCMQNWVKSKLSMQQNKNIITIFWKNLNCEICKEQLPVNIVHRGRELSLIPFDNKMTGSYLMMESFSKEKNSTGIHFIDLSSNQEFKIGRGHGCDLKVIDISVSRVHATLIVKKGRIYLKDAQSKFGTLILKKEPILLNSNVTRSPWLQCGRTFLKFSLSKQWIAYFSCVKLAVQTNDTENIGLQMIESKKKEREDEAESHPNSIISLMKP